MFKLMLVEDEPIIREGLKHYFDWNSLQFSSIIEAENGHEGVMLALKEKPDLIITDISMPMMNGLDMIEQLRPQLPGTLFVILTGYSDFQYAKRAIKIGGITDYLLKPLQYDHSLATIEKCCSILVEQQQTQQSINKQLQLHEQFKASDFIRSIITEETDWVNSSFIEEIPIEQYIYSSFIISYVPSRRGHYVSDKYWRSIAEQFIQHSESIFANRSSELRISTYYWKNKLYGLVMYPKHEHVNIEENCHVLNDHLKRIYEETGVFLFLSHSEVTPNLLDLQELYKQLDINLYQRYFCKQYYYITMLDPALNMKKSALLEEVDRELIHQCLQHAPTSIDQLKQQVIKQLLEATPQTLLAYMQELISITIRFAHKHQIQINGVYNERLLNLSFLDDFISLDHLVNVIGEWIIQLNRDYVNLDTQASPLQDEQLFRNIEQYILEHIDQDITLQMVANRFFYNPSYLSRLFKQKLNKNYSLFQAEIRIKFAKKCLENSEYSITDVGVKCGYRSYKHFVKTFKLVTRMTPTSYRKQLGYS